MCPILTTSPSNREGRRLEHKSGIWSSSEYESWNKGLQIHSSFSDVTSNVEMVLIEGFGYEEALRLADLAPVRFMNPDLKHSENRKGPLLVLMIMLCHRLRGHMMLLESCPTTEIMVVWPDVEPSSYYFTMFAQVRAELSESDAKLLDEAKDLGLTRACENLTK